jgi:hypothetical protein
MLCAITGVVAPFVYHGIFDIVPNAFDYGVVRFYGWSWKVVFATFGGMEVAPAWSPIPAVILAAAGSCHSLVYYRNIQG